MKNVEKDVVLDEVKRELSLKERIIVNAFRKTFEKVYNKTRIYIINKMIV